MKIKPLFNNVVLKPLKNLGRKTPGGLALPDTVQGEGAWMAEVVSVGPGIMVDGFFREPPKELKPGVKVFVPSFPGYRTQFGADEYLQCKDTEILSVVEVEAQ